MGWSPDRLPGVAAGRDMSGYHRIISSGQTFSTKYVTPAFWFVAPFVGAFMLVDGAFPDLYRAMFPRGLMPPVMWVAVGAWAFTGFSMALWCFPLKRVAVDDDSIYVSNYLQEIQLPLSAIMAVKENRWLKLHPVTIEFNRDTTFGRRIMFMPTIRFFTIGWLSHPIVEELRDMASFARANSRAEAQLARG